MREQAEFDKQYNLSYTTRLTKIHHKMSNGISYIMNDGSDNLYTLGIYKESNNVAGSDIILSKFESEYIRKMFFAA